MDRALEQYEFDVFISHASEDKTRFVRPLACELEKWGLKVWFDESTLKVGDSLRESIESGLSRSRYGVVIFSPHFLTKNWPKAELSALFSREMEGQKVLLPVWYKVGPAEMKKAGLAIQVDKVAALGKSGVKSVARSLIKVVRPDLLELEKRQKVAFNAGDSFIEEARRKHPGYEFAVYTGPSAIPSPSDGAFTINKRTHKIEIRVSDPALIPGPLGGRVIFSGDGAKKAMEFERTGKPQTWNPGEFELKDWNVPLMPSQSSSGLLMSTTQSLSSQYPPRLVRVEFGTTQPIVFPVMEASAVRKGTHEAELLVSDKDTPLQIRLVLELDGLGQFSGTGPKQLNLTLSWGISGFSVTECKKLVLAMDAIREGSPLRIVDVRLDQAIVNSNFEESIKEDPFSEALRRTVFLACQIKERFSVPLRMPENITEEDSESLYHLDCLLNGRAFGTVGNATARLVKVEDDVGASQEAFILGETAIVVQEPTDFPGYFPLFGLRVVTPSWVRKTEFIAVKEKSDIEAFRRAKVGTEFVIEMSPKGMPHLYWKSDAGIG